LDNIILKKIVKQLLEGKSAAEIFLDETIDGSISLEKIKELELLVKNEQPVIKLQPNSVGEAAVLNYNVPTSTSYSGLSYIILEHPKLNTDPNPQNPGWIVKPGIGDIPPPPTNPPPGGPSLWAQYRSKFPNPIPPSSTAISLPQEMELYQLLDQVLMNSGVGFSLLRMPPLKALEALAVATGLRPLDQSELFMPFEHVTMKPNGVYADLSRLVHNKIVDGFAPFFNSTSTGTINAGYISENTTTSFRPKIMLVETYSITSYLGDYGAGKTVKTFSLLPNEKTHISIKTWKTTETNFKQASSILDSWTRESSDTFENTVKNESTNRQEIKESAEWHTEGEAGFGIKIAILNIGGSVNSGTKGSTNSTREIFAKNASDAIAKQVANASSKRNVEVNTSQEIKTITGEENLLERNLENVNAGRVLNFIFRQLNQEYITYIHLTDVKLAFTNGVSGNKSYYREFNLNQIEKFLDSYINSTGKDEAGNAVNPKDVVRRMIVEELSGISDYKGTLKPFIETVEFSTGVVSAQVLDYLDPAKRLDNGKSLRLYLRVKNKPFYQNTNPAISSYEKFLLNGLIIRKNTYTLPTDSVIVEALLGQAEALDKYSQDSRTAVIESQKEEINKMKLGYSIISEKDTEKATIWSKIFPPPITNQNPPTTQSSNKLVRTKNNEL